MSPVDVRWLTAFLDFPAEDFGSEVTFWRAIAGSTVSPPRGDKREFATLEPFNGDPHLRVQRLESGLGGVHLDLHVVDVVAAVDVAITMGASVIRRSAEHVTMGSPGGFVFCLVPWEGQKTRSRPIRWPGDTISIIDQVSIDIPARAYEAESVFWQEMTGWEMTENGSPGFRHLERPRNITIRILLQRIESGEIGGHVDLASTHPSDEVSRHEDWGAEVIGEFPNWTVMADPTGRHYCITSRNPRTGELPAP